jgi:hypothetical protein
MRNKQAGVTFIGWVILLTPFAIVVYAGMRLTPIYLNYMKVSKALDKAGSELKGNTAKGADNIRVAIDKNFDIDMVEFPTTKDFKFTREDAVWVVEAAYEDEAPLFGNISIHVSFDKIVRIGGVE